MPTSTAPLHQLTRRSTAHVGKTLKVRVTFTDDDDYQHTLTSEPTTPISEA